MEELNKQRNLGFKKCPFCPAVFLASDNHMHCLKCLREGHSSSECSICRAFTPRACKYRKAHLQFLLLKEAFEDRPFGSNQALALESKRSVSAPVATRAKHLSPPRLSWRVPRSHNLSRSDPITWFLQLPQWSTQGYGYPNWVQDILINSQKQSTRNCYCQVVQISDLDEGMIWFSCTCFHSLCSVILNMF